MEQKVEISLKIDGKEVKVPEGTSVLEAARQNGVHIPTLCHHPDLTPYGGCRLCVVEVDGGPKLAASCVTPVRNGMEVVTNSERILEARRTILEFLFAERNHYCMFCAQSGDCELQNLAYEFQMDHLTVPTLGQEFPVDTSHEDIVIDHNRCVLCGRCVRACRELAGNAVLDFQNRGGRTMIGVDLSRNLGGSSCVSCGLCMQVCPTGAIFNRHRTHYAVKGKVRDWQMVESFCPECGLLCPGIYYVKANNLIKIDGRLPSDMPDRGQLCSRGRFGPMKTSRPRLTGPLGRDGNGNWRELTWEEAFEVVVKGLAGIRDAYGGQSLMGLISSGCSNEELGAFRYLVVKGWQAGYLDTLDGGHFRTLISASEGAGPNFKEAPWGAITEADLVLQIGADPPKSHPIINALIRRAILENKAKGAVIGTENTIGEWASEFLAVGQEELPSLLQALLLETSRRAKGKASKDFYPRWASKAFTGLVSRFNEADNPIIIVGRDLTGPPDPAGLKLVFDLADLKGRLPGDVWRLIILKPAGNSAGAWNLGLAARQGLNGHKPVKGGLLCLAGGEDLEPGLKERLSGLEFLAVLTPYFTDDLTAAKVLIPKPTWLETGGTYALADGSGSRFVERILEPPKGIRPVEQILAAIGQRV